MIDPRSNSAGTDSGLRCLKVLGWLQESILVHHGGGGLTFDLFNKSYFCSEPWEYHCVG